MTNDDIRKLAGWGLIILCFLMMLGGDLLHGFFHNHTIENSSHLMDENGSFRGCSSIEKIGNWATGIFFIGILILNWEKINRKQNKPDVGH